MTANLSKGTDFIRMDRKYEIILDFNLNDVLLQSEKNLRRGYNGKKE